MHVVMKEKNMRCVEWLKKQHPSRRSRSYLRVSTYFWPACVFGNRGRVHYYLYITTIFHRDTLTVSLLRGDLYTINADTLNEERNFLFNVSGTSFAEFHL